MTIFDKNYISKKSSESGFNRDTYEKVLRLVDVLEFINHDEFLNERLALKGGTAINLLELDLPRLSVDIDLDYLNNADVEQMKRDREEISARILKFMEQKGYLRKKNDRKSFVLDSYYFSYINSGGNKDNIKFDINYVMRAHIYKAIKRNVLTDLFQVDGGVNSLSSLEIYGSKINALNNRAAVRDLYDVYKLINKNFFLKRKIS
jgi:predicted nucleotidyltransferase component of viral defense system